MQFQVLKEDKATEARAGILHTGHGSIDTPVFMPVGTVGTVKGIHQHELKEKVGADILLGNTYHLYLRPGAEIIGDAGGLHKFISWDGPILTDSGGYQVYSLAHRRKISEDGVSFQSHVDGSRHFFSAESVVEIQRRLGSDIMMVLDECTPYPCDRKYAEESMEMTHRWLERAIKQLNVTSSRYGFNQVLAPIVQGGMYPDLRALSAKKIRDVDQPINAIGGLSVGESSEVMYEMVDIVCEILPSEKPRYLMGVGTPENLLRCISRGIDMFDCVLPTRNARHGLLYTKNGIINIKNAKWAKAYEAIDENSFAGRNYSKAYLRHLFVSKELLGPMIATQHNLSFYINLVKEARKMIQQGLFKKWMEDICPVISKRI